MTTILKKPQIKIVPVAVPGYHKVLRGTDEKSGLDAIIAIHDITMCRAALGGTRIFPYATFDEALTDATRLAKGMTYKSVASQSGWGGAKSVIIANPKKEKTKELLIAFAHFVDSLKGEYICAEDSGCTLDDIGLIAQHTPYVVGIHHEKGSGNPSPFTAWGVFRGIQAALREVSGSDLVAGKTVAIQGLGSVGYELCKILFWHGASLIVTDIDREKVEQAEREFSAQGVAPNEIFGVACDVFSPCALGAIINPDTIKRLRCKAIAGASNNQLLTDKEGEQLHRMGILYTPDFVINGGGLINVTEEAAELGYDPQTAQNKTDKIYDQLKLIFTIAKENGISPLKAVMRLVDYRLQYGIGKREGPIYMHHAGIRY